MIGNILSELTARLVPAGWDCERIDIHYRFTAPDKVRVVELSMYPGPQGGTVVDGAVGDELISMRFGAAHPIELIVDQLERWGALPQAVAR